jgi:hypothetical protein
MAGPREAAEPGGVTDASGDADGHGLELILDHLSWPRQVNAEQQLRDVLARQVVSLGAGIFHALEGSGELQREAQLLRGEVDLLEEAAVFRLNATEGSRPGAGQNAGSRSIGQVM